MPIEYFCVLQHALLIHCLEIFGYSTKEIPSVGSVLFICRVRE